MTHSISVLKQKLEITEVTQAQTNKMLESCDQEYKDSLSKEIERRDLEIKDLEKAIKVLEAVSS